MNTHDRETEDLLRRTFAAHDDTDPSRAELLMNAAENGSPDRPEPTRAPRRIRAVVVGAIAASILVIGLVVAAVVNGRHDDRPIVSRPPAPTATDRLLTRQEADAVATRLSQSVKDAGTFTAHISFDISAILPRTASVTPGMADPPALFLEMDERGDEPRLRTSIVMDGALQPHMIAVGDVLWDTLPVGMDGSVRWSEREDRFWHLGDWFWPGEDKSPRAVWAEGVEDVNGVRAMKYLVVKDARLAEGSTPAKDTPFSDGPVSRFEFWIDPATGRLVKASGLDEDGLMTYDQIEYGGKVAPIEPPPTDKVDPIDRPTAALTAAP